MEAFRIIRTQARLYDAECKEVDEKRRRKIDEKFRKAVGPPIMVQANLPVDPVDALNECRSDSRFQTWIEVALGPFFRQEKHLLNFATTIPLALYDLLASVDKNIMGILRLARKREGMPELPVTRRYFHLKIAKSGIPLTFYDPPRKSWEKLATRLYFCQYLAERYNAFDADSGCCLIYWTIKPPARPTFRLPNPESLPIAPYHHDPFFSQKAKLKTRNAWINLRPRPCVDPRWFETKLIPSRARS